MPSSAEYAKNPAQSSWAASRNPLQRASTSSSVSPGKPTMNDERIADSEVADRMRPIRSRWRSLSPGRRIARKRDPAACCRLRSKYGTITGFFAISPR